MSRSSVPSAALLAVVVTFLVGLAIGAGGSAEIAHAAGPGTSPNLLDHERADVAILTGLELDAGPRILVVDPPAVEDRVVTLRVLARDADGVWSQSATASVRIPPGSAADMAPWLVGLGADRFALVVTSVPQEQTFLIALRVRAAAGSPVIEEGARVVLDAIVDDGGAADVDGDGTTELVVASARTSRQGATCQGSRLWVLDPSVTASRSIDVPDRRLAAGVLGRFDDVPGDELAVFANPNCPAGPDVLPELRLVTLRLADGQLIADRAVAGAVAPDYVAPPVRVPMADGRDALLVRVPRGLAVVDPHEGWADIRLATGAALPLGAVAVPGPAGMGDPSVRVAWLEPSIDGRGSVGTEVVRRTTDGTLDSGPATVMWGPGELDLRWQAAADAAIRAAAVQGSPPALVAGLETADCPDLIVPLAQLRCTDGRLVPGPAWLATRPLAAYPTADGRAVVAAASLQWRPGEALPATPDPWAGGLPGRWRHGAGPSFALAEIAVGDLAPAAGDRVAIDRDASLGPAARITADAGTRVMVASAPLVPGEVGPDTAPDPRTVLSARLRGELATLMLRLPVSVRPSADVPPLRDTMEVPLPLAAGLAGEPTVRWSVQAIGIDDRGELGRAIATTVHLDVTPPGLFLESPVLTPVWPIAARLPGLVEPGATVRAVGGQPVAVARDGSFAIEATLAPWPQTIEVVAADAFGNEARQTLTIVGGFDYRTLPWAPILAVVVIAGVILTGVAGTRRRWPGSAAVHPAHAGVDEALTEYEELPPGGGLRRES